MELDSQIGQANHISLFYKREVEEGSEEVRE